MIKSIILSPYIFLFYDGIFCILNSIIITLLQWPMIINLPDYNEVLDKSKENNKYFSNNSIQIFTIFYGQELKFYIYFILCIVLLFFYYIINTLILFNYSPFLIILVEALLPLDSDTIKIILGQENDIKGIRAKFLKKAYYQQIGYAFLLFGALILNEIS